MQQHARPPSSNRTQCLLRSPLPALHGPSDRRVSARAPPAATTPDQSPRSPAKQQPSAWQPLEHVDAVVVDGTNLFNISRAESKRYRLTGHATSDVFAAYLTFLAAYTQAVQMYVVFDHPNRRSTQSIRSAINPNYLAKRRAKQQRTNDTGGGGSDHSALEVEARRVGAVSLTAPQGYEGDDVIAGVVDAITGCCQPPPNIVLVSADKDMQQLLADNVAWLEPLPAPTRRLPCPYVLHTAEEFEASNGFPPACYLHHLALVGKPDSGVRGTGVSDRTARKLLQRYSSIQGICAAARAGELRAANFPADVCAMFEAAPGALAQDPQEQQRAQAYERRARAFDNLQLLQLRPEAQPLQPQELLEPLLRRAQALQMVPAQAAATALEYPAHRLHRETCQPYIGHLLVAAASLQLRFTSPGLTAAGNVADLLLLPHRAQGNHEPVAVVVLGPADFKILDSQLGMPLREARRQWAALVQRKHLLQIPKAHLVGSTLARLQSLRHEGCLQLRVAPFFEVPDSEAECCQYLQQLLVGEAPGPAADPTSGSASAGCEPGLVG